MRRCAQRERARPPPPAPAVRHSREYNRSQKTHQFTTIFVVCCMTCIFPGVGTALVLVAAAGRGTMMMNTMTTSPRRYSADARRRPPLVVTAQSTIQTIMHFSRLGHPLQCNPQGHLCQRLTISPRNPHHNVITETALIGGLWPAAADSGLNTDWAGSTPSKRKKTPRPASQPQPGMPPLCMYGQVSTRSHL